jgi:hypothetical protein
MGIGHAVARQAYWRQVPIRTIGACGVITYDEQHGFRSRKLSNGDYALEPQPIHETSPVLRSLGAQDL